MTIDEAINVLARLSNSNLMRYNIEAHSALGLGRAALERLRACRIEQACIYADNISGETSE